MLKLCLLCTLILTVTVVAAESGEVAAEVMKAEMQARENEGSNRGLPIPGHQFSQRNVAQMTAGARTVLLRQISSWLAAELDITADDNHPTIEIVTPERIAAMRYRAFLPDGSTSFVMTERTMSQVKRDIVAVYSDIAQTIYLPDGWTGSTPAESSVLVHEMVHHAQNGAGLKYTCPQARERMAYLAQERWLNLFGLTLETEFDLDPMALLVKTNCMH